MAFGLEPAVQQPAISAAGPQHAATQAPWLLARHAGLAPSGAAPLALGAFLCRGVSLTRHASSLTTSAPLASHFPKMQLGTHKRGKAKREEMAGLLRKMAAKAHK